MFFALGPRLEKLVDPPAVVKKIDWLNSHWPEKLPEDRSVGGKELKLGMSGEGGRGWKGRREAT